MAIQSIDQVKINGSSKAFNGYIYNVDYQLSTSQEPSKLVIHFASEDGLYDEPTLSASIPYHITIGNQVSQNFYAIESEEEKSTSGRTLKVTFYDGSLVLDQYYIGLHKRHGFNTRASSNQNITSLAETKLSLETLEYPQAQSQIDTAKARGLIIVGSEQHPCDYNQDGVFDTNDLELLTYAQDDPCNIKCNDESINVPTLISECVKKASTDIFKVNYNFKELMDAISSVINVAPGNYDINPTYRNDDYGNLRTVLNSWCSALGLNYYWMHDTLHFFDVSSRKKIQVPNLTCLQEYTKRRSLSKTVRRGSISHYEQKGQVLDKACADGHRVALSCLTLRDLYGDYWTPTYRVGSTGQETTEGQPSGPDIFAAEDEEVFEYKDDIYKFGVPIEKLEESCICSYYDERLRWLYILRNYYGLKTVSACIAAKDKILDRFGGMQIIKVFDEAGSDPTAFEGSDDNGMDKIKSSKDSYEELLTDPELFDDKSGEREMFVKNKGFFVIARINTDKLRSQFQVEETLASSFIGKHWVRAYSAPYYGIAPEIKPDGQYIGAGTSELKNSVFTHFQHSKDSKIANLAAALKIKPAPPAGTYITPLQRKQEILKNIRGVIYYGRPNGIWSPVRESINYFSAALDKIAGTLPRVFANTNNILIQEHIALKTSKQDGDAPEYDKAEIGYNRGAKSYKIVLLAMFPGDFTMKNEETTNPYEEDPAYTPVANYSDARLGLSSKKSYRYIVWGVPVDMPAGSSCLFNKGDKTALLSQYNVNNVPRATLNLAKAVYREGPHYMVAVAQTTRPHIEIPKVETTVITPAPSSDTLTLEYNYNAQLDDWVIRALVNTKDCIPDYAAIYKAHKELNQQLTLNVEGAFESYEFTVPGLDLPDDISVDVSNGLISMTVKVTKKGIFTTYRIGNELFSPIKIDQAMARVIAELKLQKTGSVAFSNKSLVYEKA